MSTHAFAAKCIKNELKKNFPSIKFKVKASSFATGTSVRVDWFDGPTEVCVAKMISKYQYGVVNSLLDIYEITNRRSDLPQVKYVIPHREISESIFQTTFENMQKSYVGWDKLTSIDDLQVWFKEKWGTWTPRVYIWLELCIKNLT